MLLSKCYLIKGRGLTLVQTVSLSVDLIRYLPRCPFVIGLGFDAVQPAHAFSAVQHFSHKLGCKMNLKHWFVNES